MTEMQILLGQRQELLKRLSDAQEDVANAKWGKRRDEKKRVNEIEKQIKALDKKIKEANKYDYFEAGLEKGIDVRASQLKEIAGVVTAGGQAVASAMVPAFGEFGVYGKGKVGLEEQKRLAKQGSGTSNPFTSMDSKTTWMIVGAGILLLFILKRK